MNIIIAGSRNHRLSDLGLMWLDEFFSQYKKDEIVVFNGDCKTGVDRSVRWYCCTERIPYELFPAKWGDIHVSGAKVLTNKFGRKYNAKAGPDRNLRMLKKAGNSGLLIVFHGGPGTEDIYEQARKMSFNIIDLRLRKELVEPNYFVQAG